MNNQCWLNVQKVVGQPLCGMALPMAQVKARAALALAVCFGANRCCLKFRTLPVGLLVVSCSPNTKRRSSYFCDISRRVPADSLAKATCFVRLEVEIYDMQSKRSHSGNTTILFVSNGHHEYESFLQGVFHFARLHGVTPGWHLQKVSSTERFFQPKD